MENQANTKQIILNYGLILGIASIFYSVLLYATGIDLIEQPTWVEVLKYIILIVAIFLGIKKYREFNNDTLSIGQAMKVGVGIALIGGIISAIYIFILFSFIEPDLVTQIAETTEQKMLESNPNLTDEQIEVSMGYAKMFMSPFAITTMAIIGSIIIGAIIALISGLVLKKENASL